MKKWFSLAAASLVALSAAAAPVTKKFNVSDFTGIVAGSVYRITLVRSNVCSVEVTYDSEYEKQVKVYNEGSNLVLAFDSENGRKWNGGRSHDNPELSATVKMPLLTYLRLSGASRLNTSDEFGAGPGFEGRLSGAASASGLKINGESGRLEMSGASSIDLRAFFKRHFDMQLSGATKAAVEAEADEIKLENSGAASCRFDLPGGADRGYVQASGASSVTVSGDVTDLNVVTSGASRLNGGSLSVRNVQIGSSGGSSVDLQNVSGEMRVSASGASRVSYGGDPRIASQSVSKGSSLIKK